MVVGWNNHSDDERSEPIEDSQTVNESSCGLGNVSARRDRLSSRERNQLRRCDECESSSYKGCPVSEKSACVPAHYIWFESSRIVPVPEANSSLVVWTTAEHDDETEDNETHDSDELDGCEPEFSFTKDFDCDNVEEEHNNEKDGDPDSVVYGRFPVAQKDGTGGRFSCHEDCICVPIIPTYQTLAYIIVIMSNIISPAAKAKLGSTNRLTK
jgi:hypothetical protein